ncbi:uL22 family ribosomal protein [Pseudonocardia parietis]|uniref:50S ribosomal protein L22 n=1 Tax=Pseudonocardia parietis TaxID=570936 RepID=A0ABS4VMK0_9PSEU|nr:uL22 family ribosomal protein [Pseudonocardia parietis]MBP2365149.1 large subunit ribosomal protein L22 [Pseudonocardia parietis]
MEISMEPGLVTAETPQARIDPGAAIRALDRVQGMVGAKALAVLMRPGPGTCEPVARVLQGALAAAADRLGAPPGLCIVLGGEVGDGEPMTRVRRQAHGLATWITTETTRIRVELQVPTLRVLRGGHGSEEALR